MVLLALCSASTCLFSAYRHSVWVLEFTSLSPLSGHPLCSLSLILPTSWCQPPLQL